MTGKDVHFSYPFPLRVGMMHFPSRSYANPGTAVFGSKGYPAMKRLETGFPAGACFALLSFSLALCFFSLLSLPSEASAQEEGKKDVPVKIAPAPDGERWCRLKSDQVLLSGPGKNFKNVRRASAGLLLRIIGEKGDYFRVRVPDGFPCYIFHKYLEVDSKTLLGTVTGDNVHLRSIPGIEGDYPLFKVNSGETLMVWERAGDWYKVTAPEEAYLYVRKDQVSPVTVDDAVREEIRSLQARRRAKWEARLQDIRAREEQRRKQETVQSRLAELDAAVAAGFAGTSAEAVLQGYRELEKSAPDEAVRRIAGALERAVADGIGRRRPRKLAERDRQLGTQEDQARSDRRRRCNAQVPGQRSPCRSVPVEVGDRRNGREPCIDGGAVRCVAEGGRRVE